MRLHNEVKSESVLELVVLLVRKRYRSGVVGIQRGYPPRQRQRRNTACQVYSDVTQFIIFERPLADG